MKILKLALCRGRLRLSFDKNLGQHVLTKHAKISTEGKKFVKKLSKFVGGPKWWGLFATRVF